MPGSISLPQAIVDLENEARQQREAAQQPPRTIVLRYGYMKLIAELPYEGTERLACGGKVVARTGRGIELAEMVTTTCSNTQCEKSVTRKQMLGYIEASGGKNYPFSTEGRVLRRATPEDLAEQAKLDHRKRDMITSTKAAIRELDLPMKLVEVELLFGGERVIFHYTSEQWVDFRELVRRLAQEYQTRIEMHQVNARDEARLVADYEKCGQHCCCRQFLKVLRPVSMRSAKVQKATLDPTKISGRCGRLMCCLRYEDETYEALRKKLPHRQSRVITADGFGTVLDTQVLTQLALVQLDNQEAAQAYAIETLKPLPRDQDPLAKAPRQKDDAGRTANGAARAPAPRAGQQPRRPQPGLPPREQEVDAGEAPPLNAQPPGPPPADFDSADLDQAGAAPSPAETEEESSSPKEPISRAGAPAVGSGAPSGSGGQAGPSAQGAAPFPGGHRRRRRRRRRGRGGPPGQAGGNGPQGGAPGGGGSGGTPGSSGGSGGSGGGGA
jgi:cell fate regulator YaaT (PSP1 superfamily)